MDTLRRIEHSYRVRFDEADADGHLRPSGLLRYAQDVAWRHSEEAGFDREWYDARGLYWLVRNMSLGIHATAGHGDELSISTEVVALSHVWARRHTEVRRAHASADLIAAVDTDWVLLDLDGRPTRVPDEIAGRFMPAGTYSRTRIRLPELAGSATRLSSRVRPTDVDPLRHMNNAAYLDFVDDALGQLPDLARPRQVIPL